MNDVDIPEVPQVSGKDIIHTTAKAIISAIPYLGGPVAEIFAAVITPPLARRKDEWILLLATRLASLEAKIQGFKLESLSQDENFITTLLHASEVAIRNHHEEKLKALRNSVISAAIPPRREDTLNLVFIRYIDELTPYHFSLLKFLSDNEQSLSHTESYEDLFKSFLVVRPEAESAPDEFKLLCSDLVTRNLIRISPDVNDFPGLFVSSSLRLENDDTSAPTLLITPIGKAFLHLIMEDA